MTNNDSKSLFQRKKLLLSVSLLLVLLASLSIYFLLGSSHRIGQSIMSVPASGQNDSVTKDKLESLRSLPYVTWTEDDVDDTQSGITVFDENRAFPGYNIYTNDVDQVFITDMYGTVVHSWDLPGKHHCELAEFLEDGSILVICVNQALVKLTWSGEVLWEVPRNVNHDVAVLSDNSILVSVLDRPRAYKSVPRVLFDSIMRISEDGKPFSVWSTYGNLAQLQTSHDPLRLDSPMMANNEKAQRRAFDYYHLNTIEVIPDTPLGQKDKRFQEGNILLSLRNANVIVILDKDTMALAWSWGPGELDFQHMPTMLENGNILIYDNGTHRENSRIIELDPLSEEIVWEYQATPPTTFHSKWRGSNQRFPNGNTLICDSDNGRVFEVTREGEVVWEFWNPEIKGEKRKGIYRMMRLEKQRVEPFLEN